MRTFALCLALGAAVAVSACQPSAPLPPNPDPLNCKDPRNRENPYCAPSGGEPLSNKLRRAPQPTVAK